MQAIQRAMGSLPGYQAQQDAPDAGEAASGSVPRPLHANVLQRLLDDNRKYGPVLRGGAMCNHYSMALLAAHGLGAGDNELAYLHNFLDGRARVPHNELPQVTAGPRSDWTWGLGNMASTTAIRDFFLQELQAKGLDVTLLEYLPRLSLGQHKGLFHPMIRLQFGLASPHAPLEEAAEALAYSYSRHEPLYRGAPQDFAAELQPSADGSGLLDCDVPVAVPAAELEERMHGAWATLRRMFESRGYDGSGSSMQILAQLYQDESLRQAVFADLPVTPENAGDCQLVAVQLAAQLYVLQPGLTTLHAVTGGHAVIDLLPRLPPATRVVSAKMYFLWLSTLFVEKGSPHVCRFEEGMRPLAEDAWQQVRQRALQPLANGLDGTAEVSDEEPQTHVLKLAFTCDALCQKKAHPIYVDVARRVVEQGRPW